MLLKVRARRPPFTEGRQARRQISSMLLALGFGTVLGFFLDRILPHLFPFFR